MKKYFVVFTEESTKDYGFYVEAENKTQAYIQAEDKYFNFKEPDSVSTGYSKTLGHEVEEL
jgi:hypothetical protein